MPQQEEIFDEYLRLNGFLTIRNYVLHIEGGQAQEVDIIGVRLPHSTESTMYSDGCFSEFVFVDDTDTLKLDVNPDTILFLIGEATISIEKPKIVERLEKLRDEKRIRYVLNRFGVIRRSDQDILISGGTAVIENIRAHLLKVMFVENDGLAESYRKDHSNITFISFRHADRFIRERAKLKIKSRAIHQLPRHLQYYVRIYRGES